MIDASKKKVFNVHGFKTKLVMQAVSLAMLHRF